MQYEGIKIGEKKGIEIGEKKGIEIGEKKGIEIGEKIGIEIGEKNYQFEIIHELYNSGQSINYIMKITKLTKQEVEKILDIK